MLFFIYVKTISSSQMKVYHVCDGFPLNIPASNAQIFRCLPIGSSLVKLWYAEIADRCAFTVRY